MIGKLLALVFFALLLMIVGLVIIFLSIELGSVGFILGFIIFIVLVIYSVGGEVKEVKK